MTATQTITVPPRLAAVVRQTVSMAQMPQAQRHARSAIEALVKSGAVVPASPPLTIWRATEGGKMDYAPGIFVETSFDASGDVTILTLPAGRAAHFVLDGPYEELGAAWQHLLADCRRQGIELSGLNWEIYAPPPATSAHPRTELYSLLA